MSRNATRPLLLLHLLLLVLSGTRLHAQAALAAAAHDYSAIDAYALAAPDSVEHDASTLARYLAAGAESEREAARAIYRWMSDRIAYDAAAFFRGKAPPVPLDRVLASRKAVCDGYSRLYVDLAQRVGLEARIVPGRAKSHGYRAGTPGTEHAWVAVRIDGRWQLTDPSWSAGYIGEDGAFVRRYEDFWFLPPPEQMSFSHLPDERKWQLVQRPISTKQFRRTPQVSPNAFRLGFTASELRASVQAKRSAGVVEAFVPRQGVVRVRQAPPTRRIAAGAQYTFAVEAPAADDVVVVSGESWTHLLREQSGFAGTVTAQPGRTMVMVRFAPDAPYAPLLVYDGGAD